MGTASQGVVLYPPVRVTGWKRLLDKNFYFFASLLVAAIAVSGFSRSVGSNLFHAAVPRPLLLWIHGAVFSAWLAFFIVQSTLVRTRKVRWHRSLGWFGAALATAMVPLGIATAIVMARFREYRLHQTGVDAFLIIPFYDISAFAVCLALAVYWRKKPELHRRMMFIANCALLSAAFGRFDFLFYNGLMYVAVDAVILLGVVRDLLLGRSVHKVYRVAFPLLIVAQGFATYTWMKGSSWWLGIAHAILN
ncbi:MAG: hypothetical protein WA510_28155 [Acidobacteriaceae bacterium]